MIGHKIFDFEITRKIKSGGMGAVYEAKRVWGRQERVAVKFLLEQYRDDDTIRRRFIREAEIMEMLNHPRIAKVLNLDPDHNAFVMEFIEGKTLADCLRADPEKYRHPEVAVTMFAQLLDAFDYAHHVVIQRGSKQEQGVIHRDIKPSNIIIEPDGNPKILDFGISRIATFDSTLTDPKLQMGSVAYMSPEQVMSPGEVDWRSDIYALGVNLWEVFAGYSPYPQVTSLHVAVDIQNRICNEPLLRLTKVMTGLYADQLAFLERVDTIIEKATAKEPIQRYQRCKDMRDALLTTLLPASGTGSVNTDYVVKSSDNLLHYQQPEPESNGANRVTTESITRVQKFTTKSTTTAQISIETQQSSASGRLSESTIDKESVDLTPRKSKSSVGSVIVLMVLVLGAGCLTLWYWFVLLPGPATHQSRLPVKEITSSVIPAPETASVTDSEAENAGVDLTNKLVDNDKLTTVYRYSNAYFDMEVVRNEAGKRGLRSKEALVFQPQFDSIGLKGIKWGLIPATLNGQKKYITLRKNIYDEKGKPSGVCKMIPVRRANFWGYLNLDGYEMIKPDKFKFTHAEPFEADNNCTAKVTGPGGKSYRIDKSGEPQKSSTAKSAKTANQAP